QRVQPDELAAGFVQPLHLGAEAFAGRTIEPVRDQQHNRPLTENAAGPEFVELANGRPNARPARPVLDPLTHRFKRGIDIAVAHKAGDIGEASAENKSMYPVPIIGEGVNEMQQHPAVLRHRTRNITEHDKRRRAARAGFETERNGRAAAFEAGPHAPPHIDHFSMIVRDLPAYLDVSNWQL